MVNLLWNAVGCVAYVPQATVAVGARGAWRCVPTRCNVTDGANARKCFNDSAIVVLRAHVHGRDSARTTSVSV